MIKQTMAALMLMTGLASAQNFEGVRINSGDLLRVFTTAGGYCSFTYGSDFSSRERTVTDTRASCDVLTWGQAATSDRYAVHGVDPDFYIGPVAGGLVPSAQLRLNSFFANQESFDTSFGTWNLRINGRGNQVADFFFDNQEDVMLTYRPLQQNYRLLIEGSGHFARDLNSLAIIAAHRGLGTINQDGGGTGLAAELSIMYSNGDDIVTLLNDQ